MYHHHHFSVIMITMTTIHVLHHHLFCDHDHHDNYTCTCIASSSHHHNYIVLSSSSSFLAYHQHNYHFNASHHHWFMAGFKQSGKQVPCLTIHQEWRSWAISQCPYTRNPSFPTITPWQGSRQSIWECNGDFDWQWVTTYLGSKVSWNVCPVSASII